MTLSGQWNYPTHMHFGENSITTLPKYCQNLHITKALLVTDHGLADSDMVATTLKIMADAGQPAGLFTSVKGNPTGENVEDGLKIYRTGGYDGVIAFGGGSGIDAAKAIALMAGQARPLWDFEDVGDNWTRADVNGIAPIIAVPTTAGTGSEVGRASVITNTQTHEKKIIFHPKMLPEIVIADPNFTRGLPAHLTAATGLDAFVHCFEAFCAPSFHPMAEGIAVEGMRLIAENLPNAVKDGNNMTARAHMLVASSMGATAFQKGLGGVHALAHPLGALYDKHHGLLNAVILPYIMVANRAAITEKMTYLARILNLTDSTKDGFDLMLDWVLNIRKTLHIPHRLQDLDIPDTDAEKIGIMAVADPSAGGNPIPLSAADYSAVFLRAYKGDLSIDQAAA